MFKLILQHFPPIPSASSDLTNDDIKSATTMICKLLAVHSKLWDPMELWDINIVVTPAEEDVPTKIHNVMNASQFFYFF